MSANTNNAPSTPLMTSLASRGASKAAAMIKERGSLLSKNDNMAFDAYINIKDIKGESVDDAHKEWIAIRGLDFGCSLPMRRSRSDGGADTVDRVSFSTFFFTKDLDKATPKLLQACAEATLIDTAELQLCRTIKGEKKPYLKIEIGKLYITSVSSMCSADEDSIPTELVGLNFGTLKLTYTEVDLAGGKFGGNVSAGWDLTKLQTIK